MNTVTREHLKGLELARECVGYSNSETSAWDKCDELDDLIAQASGAPEQEPVAWLAGKTIWENRSSAVRYAASRMLLVRPLYAAPPSAQDAAGLVEALGAFAEIADCYDPAEDDSHEIWKDSPVVKELRLTLGQFRAAKAALAAHRAQQGAQP